MSLRWTAHVPSRPKLRPAARSLR